MQCIVCASQAEIYFKNAQKDYFYCSTCHAFFLNPTYFLNMVEEKNRYEKHNNDINDERYQQFVYPIFKSVLENFGNNTHGLDFGSGSGPVITKLLRDKNYSITTYDPFFDNNKQALKKIYDFIVCCEVMEHFYNPLKEFYLLKKLLKPKGKLFCMTVLWNNQQKFENWYYKNDPTHVIFYSTETLNWISKKVGFKKVSIENRLITFEK